MVNEVIQPRVSREMNEKLIKIPSDEEIKEAMLLINADKARGPYGFTGGFFHSFWSIIGPDIVQEIREFLSLAPSQRR